MFILTPSTSQLKATSCPTHLTKGSDGFKTILAVCNVIVTMKLYAKKILAANTDQINTLQMQ